MAEAEYQIHNKHMLIVSAVLGLIAVGLVMWTNSRIRRENLEDLIEVVTASKDLFPGDKLGPDNMTTDRIPGRLVPTAGRLLDDIARASDYNALVNMEVTQDVAAGRIVRWSYLTGGMSRAGDPRTPREGYRLVGISTDRERVTLPAGLEPGTYVDITTQLPGRVTMVPVMEKVLVKTVTSTGRHVESVGVEVRLDEAAKLSAYLAQRPIIVLWARHPGEQPSLKGFNRDVEKLIRAGGADE